jgi:1,4-alpha-glucan branching enzyme
MKSTPPQSTEPISARFPALEEQEVVLTFYAPSASRVGVAGSFNGWNPQANPLAHTAAGEWSASLMLKSGQYEYRFVADGVWADDPQATQRVANPFGGLNSVLNVRLDDRTDLL